MGKKKEDDPSEFAKVDQETNWCEIDRLRGTPLKNREYLEILWPDGTRSAHLVELDKEMGSVLDCGRPVDYPTQRAYVSVRYNGEHVRIPLLGMKCRRL